MKAIITGEDIGTTIDFRSIGPYLARHLWPEETVVSAGHGVVLSHTPGKPGYATLFMEVYPPGAAFIRGEGETPEACEDSCWKQYQFALNCTPERAAENAGHEWEPRGYKNGAGFCKHCGTFSSRIFTGEQLGQFCRDCGVGTTHDWVEQDDGHYVFLCPEHTPPIPELSPDELFKMLFGENGKAHE
ncbi:hypothetical protein [Streptomyces sp. NPDC052042]|uniref:hypothetical protein n=1 Tax=Streptomyces sp. NPDC052042 TaxID=3365683 RepID=UPI0037D8CBD4